MVAREIHAYAKSVDLCQCGHRSRSTNLARSLGHYWRSDGSAGGSRGAREPSLRDPHRAEYFIRFIMASLIARLVSGFGLVLMVFTSVDTDVLTVLDMLGTPQPDDLAAAVIRRTGEAGSGRNP